ncbi:MAG: 23S rRNA accumulation protein YceD [Gammaproteobacteria bacterium]|nr:23S rRNA accumulation protein YceD [Gammaproteobacteria bacterium]
MQKVKIPISIEPAKAALKRMTYDGIIVKGGLTRLAEVANVLDDHITAAIECGVDQQGLVVVKGKASANLELTCQRCGGDLELSVSTDFIYTPVRNAAEESEEPIPEAYEEIELGEYGEINLIQLVEDELMLALPIVAMHEPEDCSITEKDMTFGELAPEAADEKKSNPFDVLKQLKN